MEPTFNAKTIWNMDESRLKSLNNYMVLAEDAFVNWDLDNIYIYMKSIRRIASGKFKKKELDELDVLFGKLEKVKRTMDSQLEINRKDQVEYYNKADEIYVKLNVLMKSHGLFFREGKDPTRAALER